MVKVAQAQSALRVAASMHDSTRLGISLQRAMNLGLRSGALSEMLDVLLAVEEREGLWCCLSSALDEPDYILLAFWLGEAKLKQLIVPPKVRAFWNDAVQSVSALQGLNTSCEYHEVFEIRVMNAQAQSDRSELGRLIVEAERFGADPGMAKAALNAMDRRGDSGLETDVLKDSTVGALKAELAKHSVDLQGSYDKEELIDMLRALRTRKSGLRPDDARNTAESPRSRLARTLQETRHEPHGQHASYSRRLTDPSCGSKAHVRSASSLPLEGRRQGGAYPSAWHAHAKENVNADSTKQHRPTGKSQAPRASHEAGCEASGQHSKHNTKHTWGPSTRGQVAPPANRTISRDEALECLGLDVHGSPSMEDIRHAYKRAALRWHPDRHHNHGNEQEASHHFQKAREAFELLRDED